MNPVETYLMELREIRSTGGAQPETSYYGALERLLNEVGKKLIPKVELLMGSSKHRYSNQRHILRL